MNLAKTLADIATTPMRVGLAAADAGIGSPRRPSIWPSGAWAMPRSLCQDSVVHMFGLDDTIDRANRLTQIDRRGRSPGSRTVAGRSTRPAPAARRSHRPAHRRRRRAGTAHRAGRGGGPALAPVAWWINCSPRTAWSSGSCPKTDRRATAVRGRFDRPADRQGRPAGATRLRDRHPQQIGTRPRALAPTIETLREAVVAPEPGGQSAEQHRRAGFRCPPAALAVPRRRGMTR